MRFYTQQHKFYCGIDLHARTMYLCILNQDGEIVLHRNMRAAPEPFLQAIAPYREDLVVCVECIFTWYWLADLCTQEGIPFVLGHALYMKAIHGGKAKNDRIDAHKIAVLLRGGMLPQAYVYPAEMRATRDLLRRRMYFMRQRAALLAHVQNTNSQYNLPEIGKKLAYKGNRDGVAERFADPAVHKSIEVDLALIDSYDRLLSELELAIVKTAKQHDANTFYRLQSVPGIGKILAWCCSMRSTTCSASPGCRSSSPMVAWSNVPRNPLASAMALRARKSATPTSSGPSLKRLCCSSGITHGVRNIWLDWRRQHGKGKALTVLAHKLARAVYYMCKRETAFDMRTFLHE